jgi:hypothetical protein
MKFSVRNLKILISPKLYGHWKTNPSSPPLPTGRQALQKGGISPLWQRGVRGDFRMICLLNYGLINKSVIPV